MSRDHSNLLLELLQNNDTVFNLDDLGQSPQVGYLTIRMIR